MWACVGQKDQLSHAKSFLGVWKLFEVSDIMSGPQNWKSEWRLDVECDDFDVLIRDAFSHCSPQAYRKQRLSWLCFDFRAARPNWCYFLFSFVQSAYTYIYMYTYMHIHIYIYIRWISTYRKIGKCAEKRKTQPEAPPFCQPGAQPLAWPRSVTRGKSLLGFGVIGIKYDKICRAPAPCLKLRLNEVVQCVQCQSYSVTK